MIQASIDALNKDDVMIISLDDYLNTLDPSITELKITSNILDANDKQLNDVPRRLSQRFPNIKRLTISGHLITSIPEDILNMRLEYINLSHNKLIEFPLFRFTDEIKQINYSHNEITELPEEYLYMFPRLNYFNMSYNHIKKIPDNLFATHQEPWGTNILNMQLLNKLYLNNNEIETIPVAFKIFGTLNYNIYIDLSHNKIKTIPLTILNQQPPSVNDAIDLYYKMIYNFTISNVIECIEFFTQHSLNTSGLFYVENGTVLHYGMKLTDTPIHLNISSNPLLYDLPPYPLIDLHDIRNNGNDYFEFNKAQHVLTIDRSNKNNEALEQVNVLFNSNMAPNSSAKFKAITNTDIANNVYDFLREPSLAEKKAKKGGRTTKRKRSWSRVAPGQHERTLQLARCGHRRCFLGKGTSYPICARGTCRRSKKGIHAAYVRASQYHRRGIAKKARRLLGRKQ